MKLFFLILIIGLAAFLQSFGFSILGVKPDLALAAVITASFFIENILQGFLLVALAALILKFSPGFEPEIAVLSLIGVVAVIVKKYLPWHYFFGNLILIAGGTLVFYAFLAPNLIISFIFLEELVLNLAAGSIIFAFLSFCGKINKTRC
jgi:hypothetical protein